MSICGSASPPQIWPPGWQIQGRIPADSWRYYAAKQIGDAIIAERNRNPLKRSGARGSAAPWCVISCPAAIMVGWLLTRPLTEQCESSCRVSILYRRKHWLSLATPGGDSNLRHSFEVWCSGDLIYHSSPTPAN